jgi:hypothetical protein
LAWPAQFSIVSLGSVVGDEENCAAQSGTVAPERLADMAQTSLIWRTNADMQDAHNMRKIAVRGDRPQSGVPLTGLGDLDMQFTLVRLIVLFIVFRIVAYTTWRAPASSRSA